MQTAYATINTKPTWIEAFARAGNSKGLPTERIVASIWENVVMGSDFLIDFHEGGRAYLARYIGASTIKKIERRVRDKIEKLYKFFGQGVPVRAGQLPPNSSMIGAVSTKATLSGPCIVPELGGGSQIWEELVQDGINGARNVMIGLGML